MQPANMRWVLTPAVALITLALDFGSKLWAKAALADGLSKPFVPGILQLTLTANTGGAFGIGRDSKEVMTLLAVTICAAIAFWVVRRERGAEPLAPVERVGFGCILGGAFGNILDRLLAGRVTDFLEFTFVQFPVFNVADAMIDVGVGLLLIYALFGDNRKTAAVDKPHE